jgi:hypothetical protein
MGDFKIREKQRTLTGLMFVSWCRLSQSSSMNQTCSIFNCAARKPVELTMVIVVVVVVVMMVMIQ